MEASALVFEAVGGNLGDLTLDDGQVLLLQGREPDLSCHADGEVVGVCRRSLRLDDKTPVGRNDLHQRVAGDHDAAFGEHLEGHDLACGRRADGGAANLLARRVEARQHLVETNLHVAKLSRDFFLGAAVDADHAEARLADRLCQARGVRAERTVTPVKVGDFAFHRPHAVQRDIARRHKFLQALQLFAEQLFLEFVGHLLVRDARNLLVMLADALLQHVALVVARAAARSEQPLLARHRFIGQKLVLSAEILELRRAHKARVTRAFRDETGALRIEGDRLAGKSTLLSHQLGSRNLQQEVALLDHLAFLHVQHRDDAAVAMLNRLAVARHGDDAIGGRCCIKRDERGPPEKAEEKHTGDRAADAQLGQHGIPFRSHHVGAIGALVVSCHDHGHD